MTDAPPETPPSPAPAAPKAAPTKKKTPWWLPVVVVLGALPAVFALFIFTFVVRYSVAHDVESCPYTLGEPREVERSGGVRVREDHRSCMEDVRDHRWVVLRPGTGERSLGNLPLMGAEARFEWEARIEEERVVIDVVVPGRGELSFREPPPAE